jgi:hypothetical protein
MCIVHDYHICIQKVFGLHSSTKMFKIAYIIKDIVYHVKVIYFNIMASVCFTSVSVYVVGCLRFFIIQCVDVILYMVFFDSIFVSTRIVILSMVSLPRDPTVKTLELQWAILYLLIAVLNYDILTLKLKLTNHTVKLNYIAL